jgi:hypothetical protein
MLVSIDIAILGGVVVGGALLVVPIVVAGAGVAVATVDVGAVGVGDVMPEVVAPLHAAATAIIPTPSRNLVMYVLLT